jgi:hypothetical protein
MLITGYYAPAQDGVRRECPWGMRPERSARKGRGVVLACNEAPRPFLGGGGCLR